MKSIDNAMRALRLLVDNGGELRVGDTSRHLDMTRGNASRLLASLARGGLLEQDPSTQRYRAGILAVQIAASFHRNFDLVEQARKEMEELAHQTEHTVWLGVPSGTEVIVLKTVRGPQPIQFTVEPGHKLPAHAAAMGKALLALKTDQEIRTLYSSSPGLSAQRANISVEALLRDIAVTRMRGYAVSDQELFEGVRAVSVSFEDPQKSMSVAISVSYPLFAIERTGDQLIVEALLTFGRGFGARIGDKRWIF
ncbi:IclR family transcriptional regulator [Microvirga pudoricolor]|uniref:IclR family transcriptional regulator n=1 Tax=Microvirga pudoricolor TaxID=2778729 RepID=UPI00194E6E59|nr:IclR family transcriptional regulator [Microvirga pudoricolor]MBM6595287.1 IclR family transcriptional regulator [Microvirga pudoricolor]